MRPRKVKRYVIPIQAGDVIRGDVIVANQFPGGTAGRPAAAKPAAVPAQYDFDQYVQYYTDQLADFVESLNGLQWTIEDPPTDTQQKLDIFRALFQSMAEFLEVKAPAVLSWPLHGFYSFELTSDPGLEGRIHQLNVNFDSDELYGLVLNFELEVREVKAGIGGPEGISGGSSYIGTGSK